MLNMTMDGNSYNDLFKYFCSQGCANQWLNKNMACVEGRTVVPFTTHRKTSEAQYENTKIKARLRQGNNMRQV